MNIKNYIENFYKLFFYLLILNNFQLNVNANDSLKNNNSNNTIKKTILWEKVEEEFNNKNIKWHIFKNKNKNKNDRNSELIENQYDNYLKDISYKNIEKEFLYLGFAVPNAKILNKGDFRIYVDQLFPFTKGDFDQGTANQNYSVFLNYTFNESFLITGFFSYSDDPLYKKINNIEKQPANKWVSIGSGSRINILKNEKIKTALDSSVELWYVKSGGCDGIGCKGVSSNIFDKSLNEYENFNLIGSLALATTFKLSNKTDIILSPKITFLPEKQFHRLNSGLFYGLNTGFGLGISHKFYKRLSVYLSTYIPLTGYNYFDENLTFRKSTIYNLGLNYVFDPKISFQTYLTNSFGSTPATGILTIPSDNNLIIGTRLIYEPTALDLNYDILKNDENKFDGLSVSNTLLVNPDKTLFDIYLNKDGSIWTTITKGISSTFNFEITTGSMSNIYNIKNKFSRQYIGSNEQNLRAGGKVILFSEGEHFPFSSAIRMTFGRSLGETWLGYLFIENINSKKLSEKLFLNITPKMAWTGSGNPSALGTSLMFNFYKQNAIIIETNMALNDAESNWTSALRISKNKNKYLDLYVSNALNFFDIGELINSKGTTYGIKIGIKL